MEKFDINAFGRMYGLPVSDIGELIKLKSKSSEGDCNFDCGDTDTGASMKCAEPVGEFPSSTPIGMMYVPYQSWETPYDDTVALSRGTMFPSLDKPFIGGEALRNVRTR